MNPFYSPRELSSAPHFVMNLVITAVGAVIIVAVAAFFLVQNSIYVDPIAELKILPRQVDPSKNTNNAEFQSAILSDAKTKATKSLTLFGYLADVRDVCNRFEEVNASKEIVNALSLAKPSLVLVKTNDRYIVGTARIGSKTCELVKKINGSSIYLTSDSPFLGIPSSGNKEFFTVNAAVR